MQIHLGIFLNPFLLSVCCGFHRLKYSYYFLLPFGLFNC
nr:MAG TPA: hypothetical protein [Caudoviricetes sp.]